MTITVNGKTLNMNIGCRTYTSVSRLMDLLEVGDQPGSIELNGKSIERLDFGSTTVSNGDILVFSAAAVNAVAPSARINKKGC
jgi:sulfur carrier protein ThiS